MTGKEARMEKRLVLEDSNGTVLRAYGWRGEPLQVIRRSDTRRLEVVPSTEHLEKKKIAFEKLGEVKREELENKPFLVGKLGHLRIVEDIKATLKDEDRQKAENQNRLYWIFALLVLMAVSFLGVIRSMEPQVSKLEESLKQEVVKIVKAIPPKQKVEMAPTMNKVQTTAETKTAKTTTSLKRMGALAALGSLNSGKQKGGLDLGAVNTTAGPGLGGTQGSGGVQTSLYGKGIASAPLGAGNNIQGAGGYGTKGKGGGQAGYGKLSLIGSAGTDPIPLAQEASVASGLDRDAIAAVIQKNLGQVRFCYEQGLQGDAALNGRVAVDFTIGGNGLVKAASVGNSSLNSKIVEDCIVMRLKTWKFPLPQGGVDVKVSYPFVLRRAGQG
jgi:hypothetical protein